MSLLSFLHLLGLIATLVVGAVVYLANSRRQANRYFFILSINLALWLLSLAVAFVSRDPDIARLCVRCGMSFGTMVPVVFNWLRVAIVRPNDRFKTIFFSSPWWLGVALVVALACQTPLFVVAVTMPDSASLAVRLIPEPVYTRAFAAYNVYYVAALALLATRLARDVRRTEGIVRTELQFVLLGSGTSIFVGILTILMLPYLTGSSQSAQFTPLSVILLYVIIGYGIATRRIMGVAYLVRVVTAYVLLAAYLSCVYAGVWALTALLMHGLGLGFDVVPYVVAALAVAFSLAPAQGWMQRFANRLFGSTSRLDISTVIESANRILRSISTVDTLLADFADTVGRAVGTDRILILIAEKDRFVQRFPPPPPDAQAGFGSDDALIRVLRKEQEALVPELVRRVRATPLIAAACQAVEALQMTAAVGMRSPEGMEGVVLFGPRLSGRIYGSPEQQTLQLLCNQLAVALNNARLYTQVQDGKIYNDVLVDSLASGVIAAGTDGVITVFNREAQRITGLEPADVLGHPLHVLFPPLAAALETALQELIGQRDRELDLVNRAGEEVPVRVSSAIFYGHTGRILGAFLVMNDLTAVKRLELQIRRSDRLASLGTLAAGMAHEIKNPLVSIKTFTQLLPERYEDGDFRETFFSLVGNEVKRIDLIVNQLLRFSRPAKPNLVPTALHDILANTLNLMMQQMRQSGVTLSRAFEAPSDCIQADGDQLNQAFINFVLNAIEAMPDGGTLTVSTGAAHPARLPPGSGDGGRRWLQVAIGDTGSGIAPANLARIFDPFFTTKIQGTGLGLSVAHRIITEHGGLVDVVSEVGRGTTFYLILPLITPEGAS